MRNFARINSYYNKQAARQDWERLAREVRAAGLDGLVKQHEPPATAGYQRIDGSTARLRQAYERAAKGGKS